MRPGTHVCALYSGPEERDRLLVPFMQGGLRRGDRCIRLVDQVEPPGLGRPGDALRSGYVDEYPASEVYLWAGEFSVERLTAFLTATVASSTDDESPQVRVAAEMSWVLHEPDAEELLVYESAVHGVLAEVPGFFLCLYDLQRFRVGMIVDVLRLHSQVLLDGTVLDNPHSLASNGCPQHTMSDAVARYPLTSLGSGAYDGAYDGANDGGDPWLSLTGAEVRVAELVASGMTNRAMAEELIVSPHTVDAHLKHMYLKLGIHSRVELTVLALQHARPTA
jgi:DNA-binding CsgD family transcriptional regulator